MMPFSTMPVLKCPTRRDPASGHDRAGAYQLTDVKNVLTIPLSALGDPPGTTAIT
jgi:hypothetical protein